MTSVLLLPMRVLVPVVARLVAPPHLVIALLVAGIVPAAALTASAAVLLVTRPVGAALSRLPGLAHLAGAAHPAALFRGHGPSAVHLLALVQAGQAPSVHRMGTAGWARLTDVTLTPDTSALPGGQVLQNLMNGIGGWALALALVGLIIGAAAWALGSHGQNYQQSYVGRRAVLISGLAALLIGAGPAIVNFFFHAGQGVH
jgi:hypothetical protein